MFMCYFSSSYLGNRVPELNVLETPFLFPDLATAHQALDGDLGSARSPKPCGPTPDSKSSDCGTTGSGT